MKLDEIFNTKLTENGDDSYVKPSLTNDLINILFLSEYYQKHLDEVPNIGASYRSKLFAMFMRDPRFGIGRRDLGRILMHNTDCSIEQIVKAGRIDDLFTHPRFNPTTPQWNLILDWCKEQILAGNELVKKWMPRYSSKNLLIAREIAKYWGMNKQQYGKFIKCNTTENKLSRKNTDEIVFEHVPSLAMIKYAKRFANGADTAERYAQYLSDVKAGKKDLKISTTSVYDIYRHRNDIDPDIFFDKIEKIKINCIPIVDTSGSMCDSNDSFGKALAIGHYLAKCSTYCPNQVVSFSSRPQLITLGKPVTNLGYGVPDDFMDSKSQYHKEIASMYTGDCSNTDFGKVMELLSKLGGPVPELNDMPEYLVVLSDMEFDYGSSMSKDRTMQLFRSKGYNTKIVWWNLNSRATTAPEMDKHGNIFLSGYNPQLLKFLEVGFDAEAFLDKLLREYAKAIQE
jgi:hypothetical protein